MADYGNGGMLVSTSQNYVNAYTGQAQAFDANNTMSPQMKTYYDTEAIENTRARLVFGQFGRKQPLPENHGTTVERRKRNTFGDVGRLVEGVIPRGKKFGYSAVTMNIYEYGDYSAYTEWLNMHAIDNVVLDMTEEHSAAGANTMDKLFRDELLTGTNVVYAPILSGDTETEVDDRSEITDAAVLTPDVIAKVATIMSRNDVPGMNGDVGVAIIHPDVAYDLRKSDYWVEAHKYASPEEIYNGEIGKLHGFRFVQTSNAKIFKAKNLAGATANLAVNGAVTNANEVTFDGGTVEEGALNGRWVNIGSTLAKITYNTATVLYLDRLVTANDNATISPEGGGADGAAVYASIFLGKDAFDVIDPAGGGMEIIVKSKKEVGGPLEQFGTVGVKFSTGAKLIYDERCVRVESGATFGPTAEGN